MERLPPEVVEYYSFLVEFVDLLKEAIDKSDCANVVRSCSHISYIVGDILESAIPDDYVITIKKNK